MSGKSAQKASDDSRRRRSRCISHDRFTSAESSRRRHHARVARGAARGDGGWDDFDNLDRRIGRLHPQRYATVIWSAGSSGSLGVPLWERHGLLRRFEALFPRR